MTSRYFNAQGLEFDNFGQGETLTTRIKGLLEDYKDGIAVLKELIQNADDAGATEVHFMYDSRDLRESSLSLIDQEMKSLQGPALLCYNNETFSEEDFTNIAKLGGATKEKKVDQVGRFGLGFNAVYNLTDVPSFISDNDIVFFDPHVKYLKNVIKSPSKPGIRMNLKKNKVQILSLKDQFKVFHGILGCDLQNETALPPFEGTLFRFPLRTEVQAAESDISRKHYDRGTVVDLFQVLLKSADHLLLFVQNVRKVIISEITKSGDVQQCGVINKQPLKVLRPLKHPQIESVQNNDIDEWKILKCAKMTFSHDMFNSYIIEMSTKFDGALFEETHTSCESWLVSNCVKANLDDFRRDFLLPIGSIGISLKRLGDLVFSPQKVTRDGKNSGQVFCFLPLPVETALPFHINGYFAVTSSRQQLRTQDVNDIRDKNALWNERLMREVVVKALLQGLTDLTCHNTVFPNTNKCLFDLYPQNIVEQDDLLHCLCKSFYDLLVNDNTIKILPSPSGNWIPFDKCRYLGNRNYVDCVQATESSRIAKIMVTLCKTHLANDFVDLPEKIIIILMKLGFENSLLCHKILLRDFYKKIFLSNITSVYEADRDELVHYALLQGDGEVDLLLKETRCIPVTCSDSLMEPGQLVDPSGPLSQLFSEEEGSFPIWLMDPYSQRLAEKKKNELQQALRRLGMRVDDLTMSEVLERSRTISTQPEDVGKSRCRIVLQLLSNKLRRDEEFNGSSKDKLCDVAFLPVKKKPPQWVYPWRSDLSFVEPANSFTEDVMFLVGCSEYIVDFPGGSDELKKALYSNKDIPLGRIVDQINHVTTETKTPDWETRKWIMTDIYKLLEQRAKQDDKTIYNTFRDIAFIEVSDGNFVKPCMCALSVDKNLAPFLYKIPSEFPTQYKTLTQALKIEEQFQISVLLNVLEDLYTQHLGENLSQQRIEIAIKIASLLESTKQSIAVEDVFLPDSENIMAKASELCYNDCSWLQNQQERTLHMHIPYPVAKALGVTDLRQKTVLVHQTGIPFGQSEKLTRRIKGILDSYPCGSEILKEILQNADDADATEVYFILDHRTHSSISLFNSAWEKLQGPALLVYNNRPFTEKDMEGIKNLGTGGSKEKDPITTGKYGVGFNCVYHVTETPMFLTPDNHGNHIMVAFDPHCKYVEGSTMSEPGQMYKDVKKLRTQFPDVFECFDFPQLPEINVSSGILFRLPFRTYKMAQESQLKTEEFTTEDCKGLFEEFQRGLKENLLFLKNVKRIGLFEIKTDNEIIKLDDAVSEPIGPTYDAQTFMQQLRTCSEQVKTVGLQNLPSYTHKYQTNIQDSQGNKETWLIVNQIGFRNKESVTDDFQAKFRQEDASLIPQGGAAVKLKPEMSDAGKFFCLLPLPVSTYLPVHINGTFFLDHESRRNLWQAEKGSKSFKVLWNLVVLTGIVAETYVDMVQEVALLDDHDTIPHERAKEILSQYQRLFPVLDEKDEYLLALQESVYAAFVRRNVKILPVVSYLETGKELDKEYPDHAKVDLKYFHVCGKDNEVAFWGLNGSDNDVKIKHILRNSQFPLVCDNLTTSIKNKFPNDLQDAGPGEILKHFLGQTSTQFRMTCPLPLKMTPFVNPNGLKTLLSFCKEALPQYFEGLPMLLMRDDTVHTFATSQAKILLSKYDTLVPAKTDLFANTLYLHFMDVENCDKYLKHMSLADLGNLIEHALPPEMCLEDGVMPLDESLYTWLYEFWKFVETSESYHEETNKTDSEVTEMGCLKLHVQECFKRWCILPVVLNGNYYCALPSYLDLVVNLSSFRSVPLHNFTELLNNLNYPQPLLKLPQTNTTDNAVEFLSPKLSTKMIISLDQPQNLLFSMRIAMCRKLIDVEVMSLKECHTVAVYFNDSWKCNYLQETKETREILLSIPMFITVFEEQVSINSTDIVYTVPSVLIKEGMKKWCGNIMGHVYLKHQDDLNDLYKKLGFQCLTFVTMYTEHILCHFQYFDEHERFSHLQVMKRFVEDCIHHGKTEHEPLLAKLEITPVLEDERETLQCARYFFNPQIDLFKEMETAFPNEKFHGSDWINFLSQIGLQYKPNQNHIVSYAQQIEALSHNTQHHCKSKCKVLVEILFKDACLLQSVSQKISSIRFIPQKRPKHQYTDLYPMKQHDDRHFICFCGSVERRYGELCWTQLPILPEFAVPQKKIQCQCLGILALSFGNVIRNMDTVCKHYQDCVPSEKCNLIAKFMAQAFEYILKHEKDQDVSAIAEIPCVPVENSSRLVRPEQIVLQDLPKEIPPFLYKLPLEFARYHELLSRAGASQNVTIEQCIFVLEEIWKISAKQVLRELEIERAEEALQNFFGIVDKDKTKVRNFYLLTCPGDKKLLNSKEVVFNDKPKWSKRVQQLGLPFMAKLRGQIPIQKVEQVLRQLPENLQPKYLSEIVTEHFQDVVGETSKSQRCKELEQRLTSELFHSGIVRIMHNTDSDQDTDADLADMELAKTLERVKLYEVAQVVTFLVHNGTPVPGSEMSSSYFIQRKDDEITIYLSKACQSEDKVHHKLFAIINELMKNRLEKHGLLVNDIMKCDIHRIEEVLDELDVKQYETTSCRRQENNMPILGIFIPLEFHHILQHSMGLLPEENEYVGYELHDPLDDPNIERKSSDDLLDDPNTEAKRSEDPLVNPNTEAKSSEDPLNDPNTKAKSSEDPVYIYAKVIEVIIPEGITSSHGYKYKIQIGHDDYEEVSAASLYCFPRSIQRSRELDVADGSDMNFEHTIDTGDSHKMKMKEDIRNTLKDTWNLGLSEKKKIIKRLLLKWHPDKNPGREDLCSEVFKYIKWVYDQLEQGLSVSEDNIDGCSPHNRQIPPHHSGKFWSNFNFDGYTRRAQSQSHYQNRFEDKYSSHSAYTPPRYTAKNPQPSEANRWMRQAFCDFSAVQDNSMYYEWDCFKYHQVRMDFAL